MGQYWLPILFLGNYIQCNFYNISIVNYSRNLLALIASNLYVFSFSTVHKLNVVFFICNTSDSPFYCVLYMKPFAIVIICVI